MNSKSFAFLSLLATLTTTLPAWAAGLNLNKDTVFASGDTLAVDGTLTLESDVDLAGRTLILKGVSGMSGGYTITDSVGGGELDIEVTGDFTQTAVFKGKLRFIKRGEKKLTLLENEFSGGMEVCAGEVIPKSWGNKYKYFGNPPDVVVDENAVMSLNACYGFATAHKITLAGGTLSSNRADNDLSNLVRPSVKLTKDSTFSVLKPILIGSSIDLGGNTLTLSLSAAFAWSPAQINDGVIEVSTGTVTFGTVTLRQSIGKPADGKPTADLILRSGTGLTGDFIYSVNDLTVETTADKIGSTIAVYGTYKPSSLAAYAPKMMNGSTLDLSELNGAYSAQMFEEGTAEDPTVINLVLPEMELKKGVQIIEWTTEPKNIKFVFPDGATEIPAVSGSGVYYGADTESTELDVAIWTGNKQNGELGDAGNWKCQTKAGKVIENVLPDEHTSVRFTGDLGQVNFSEGCAFNCLNIVFSEARLTDDQAWPGLDLDKVDSQSQLDLAGNMLTLTGRQGACTGGGVITDTVGGGELHFDIAADVVHTNENFTFDGGLKLVVDGPGVYVTMKDSQLYTNVTEIVGGVLRCKDWANYNNQTPFGLSKKIVVKDGGSLDPAGSCNWKQQNIILDGGTISNTVAEVGIGTKHETASTTVGPASAQRHFNPIVTLLSNAMLASTKNFNFRGTIAESENTLDVWVPNNGTEMIWDPANVVNASVNFVSGGYLRILEKFPVNQSGFRLTMSGAALKVGNDFAVQDYTAGYAYDYNTGTGILSVSGTFTPMNEYFYGCEMLDGSVINVNKLNMPLGVMSAAKAKNTVTFANDATVTIDVHERISNLSTKTPIVTWDTAPTNLDTLTFVIDDESSRAGFMLVKTDNGLYAKRKGLVLLFR